MNINKNEPKKKSALHAYYYADVNASHIVNCQFLMGFWEFIWEIFEIKWNMFGIYLIDLFPIGEEIDGLALTYFAYMP